jgi:pimeloyl-ACP methyl ester carboxylesterase
MISWLPAFWMMATGVVTPVETRLIQVAPALGRTEDGVIARSTGQGRAIVLIQGLNLHLLQQRLATKAVLRPWQQPGSVLVRTLAPDADVFAFTYAQTAPVTDIGELPALGESVLRLRRTGYSEVVLIGFSAGGVVARQFVEDNPHAGVTRVIQVCAPNVGSALAKFKAAVGPVQGPFVQSLTRQARSRALQERRDKTIPPAVDFVCIVGDGLLFGDGVVSIRSQWPEDLQTQGVPAVPLRTEHWEALRDTRAAQVIAGLAKERQPRWNASQVAAMRQRLWHEQNAVH